MTIEEMRDKVNTCYFMCDYVYSRTSNAPNATLYKTLQMELLKYVVYISSIEEDISDEKINIINKILKTNYTKMMLLCVKTDMLIANNFLNKIPMIFRSFITDDMLQTDARYSNSKGFYLLKVYEELGDYIISLDRVPIKEFEIRKRAYCDTLKKFINTKTFEGIENMDIPVEKQEFKQETDTPLIKNETASSNTKEAAHTKVEEFKEDPRTLEELMDELNSLTGLTGVKKEIKALTNLIKVNKMREEKGLKPSNVSKHMVFTGNPGTGKTTVARLLSCIYAKLGVLSKGQLIETDRSGLVAGFVGQTALKSQEVIQTAIGGVLFIDEAYTLSAGKGASDFGQEAIDTLLKMMEDNRDDLVVVVAGYPDLMEDFLQSNPGLKSRFNKFIEFEDYTAEELSSIMYSMCDKQEFCIAEDSKDLIFDKIKELVQNKEAGFANARSIRNMIEDAIRNQAERLVEVEEITIEDLTTLNAEDFNIERASEEIEGINPNITEGATEKLEVVAGEPKEDH